MSIDTGEKVTSINAGVNSIQSSMEEVKVEDFFFFLISKFII